MSKKIKKKRVLYAEDEYTNSRMLQLTLQSMGMDCDIASNGKEAIRLFHENHYDLILVDQYMPIMNGDKVTEHIRSRNPSIPIIAITSDDQQITNLKSKGCNEVLVKPLRGKAYKDIITAYLENHVSLLSSPTGDIL